MRIGELAHEAGVTTKAVRYYESVGLIESVRLSNGYRDYDERHVRLVREIRELSALGVRVEQARPFLDCLIAGRGKSDDCPDSISTYRNVIAELDGRILELSARRAALATLLNAAELREAGIHDDEAGTQPRCAFEYAVASSHTTATGIQEHDVNA
jgi:DNA-binding transcriptional MerR regulator